MSFIDMSIANLSIELDTTERELKYLEIRESKLIEKCRILNNIIEYKEQEFAQQ